MKKTITLLSAILSFSAAFAQNVGVGTNAPGAKLTVNGALASTPQSGAAGATITIPANVTVFRIMDDGASAANAVTATGPVEGQYLTIYNTDAQAATFAGQTIAATSGVMTFQYINTGWRLVSDNQATGGNYIKNNTSVQPTSNFNISNAGVIGTTLTVGTSATLPVVQGSTAASGTLTLSATSSGTKPAAGILMTDNIPSTSTTTGTSVITGGQGISGNLNIGGNASVTGTSSLTGAVTFGNTVTVTPFTAGGVVTNTAGGVLGTTAGTTSTVLHGNAAGTPSFGAVALGSEVSGILPVANGGTGSNTQSWVDLTNTQTAAGNKTWTGTGTFSNGTYSALMTGGNVGIGSSTPAAKLTVITANSDGNVAAWGTGQMTVGQDGASAGALGFSYSTTNNTGYISALAPSAAWKDLGIRAASTYFYYNGGNEIMRLNNAGNVSIGGVAPTAQFHTTGTVRLANYASGLIATDATGTLTAPRTITAAVGTTSGTNQLNITNGNGVSGNPAINMHDTYAALLHANANLTGGGNISFIAGNFNWSNRFIVISNGNGSQYSTSGYFDITQPATGTITGVGGAGNVTATASGIPLGAWQALYYIVPVGSNNGSVAANFRVAQYTSALVVPENWLLLAVVNGDDGTVRVGNGIILQPNQTWTTGSGLNSGWGASVNMISSRDDLNSTGSSNSVPAGIAMTSLVGSGSDDNQYGVNIPFTVYIGGVAATWLGISTNGFIQFNSGNSYNGALNSNGTLPNASFSIPTFCYYWDDMVTTGNGLRYTTVGTAPNRVFILDYELRTYAAGSFVITGQVHIHEGSNEINVRYNTNDAYACGQGATLGLQLTQSIAMPVSCNAKVLDDNTTNTQSMTFSPTK